MTRLNSRDKKQKRDDKAKQDHLEHIPFRLREIMKSKDRMKTGPLKAKKLKEGEQKSFFYTFAYLYFLFSNSHGLFAPSEGFVCVSLVVSPKGKPEDSLAGDIPVPHFKRGKKESEKAYLRRMDSATKHVLFLTENQFDRKPELVADQQESPADKGKSEKKKEWVHWWQRFFLTDDICLCW